MKTNIIFIGNGGKTGTESPPSSLGTEPQNLYRLCLNFPALLQLICRRHSRISGNPVELKHEL